MMMNVCVSTARRVLCVVGSDIHIEYFHWKMRCALRSKSKRKCMTDFILRVYFSLTIQNDRAMQKQWRQKLCRLCSTYIIIWLHNSCVHLCVSMRVEWKQISSNEQNINMKNGLNVQSLLESLFLRERNQIKLTENLRVRHTHTHNQRTQRI